MTKGNSQSGLSTKQDATRTTPVPITIASRPWLSHGHNRLWVSKYGGVSERRPSGGQADPLTDEWIVHQHPDPPVNTSDWQVVDPPSVDITYKSVLLECKPSSTTAPSHKTKKASS